MISDEAVEAAMRASYLRHDWDNQYERNSMRRALAAAAPFIAAQAWEEGYRECYERQMYEPVPYNPYRSGT